MLLNVALVPCTPLLKRLGRFAEVPKAKHAAVSCDFPRKALSNEPLVCDCFAVLPARTYQGVFGVFADVVLADVDVAQTAGVGARTSQVQKQTRVDFSKVQHDDV